MKHMANRAILIFALLSAGTLSLYLAVLKPSSFGFYHDDGIYVVTAKALATDQGYRIISLPGEPAQTKYPPFYPFLLSLIWRVRPQFPGNLSAMMLLSAVATIGFLALTWSYLTTQRYASKLQALLVVSLAAINWRTLIVATGIYSEMFYAVLSIAGLYLAESYRRGQENWKRGAVLGMLIGLAFLTRTSGLALLIAVAVYLALHKKLRSALVPIAVASFFLIAWIGWSYINGSTSDGVNAAYYTSYFRDLSDIIMELQRQSGSSRLSIFLGLILKNLLLIAVSIPAVCLGLRYDSIQNIGGYSLVLGFTLVIFSLALVLKGFLRDRLSGFRLLHIYTITYIALHLPWPYGVYDRFLLPLLPFLLLFLTTEARGLIQLARTGLYSGVLTRKLAAMFVTSAIALCSGITIYNYAAGVHRSLSTSKENASKRAEEDADAIGWINANTDTSEVLVCYRDPLYYLYTGHKATRSSSKDAREPGDQQTNGAQRATTLFRILDENNAGYLISTSSDFELEGQAELHRQWLKTVLQQNPEVFVPVFETKTQGSTIYRINKRY